VSKILNNKPHIAIAIFDNDEKSATAHCISLDPI
jgi:hypothetical protein